MKHIRTAVLAAVLAVPMLAAAVWTTPAGAAHRAVITSAPNWYPLHDSEAAMDCYISNPGCPVDHRHKDKAVTFLTHGSDGKYHNVPVYAAGAGTAHIGHIGMPQCNPTPGQPLGNWVWIDHGGGVVSRYAHLYAIRISNGQQVTAHTIIASSGSSGESAAQCGTKYLNFQIEHGASGGANGTGYAFTILHACDGTRNVAYPSFVDSRYQTWNQFPKSVFVPGKGWQHMITPGGGHACLP
jgi:hypothetical protein